MSIKKQFSVTVVLFEDFELLDACCPVGLMSRFPELGITMVGAHVGGVRSYRGVSVAATRAYDRKRHHSRPWREGGSENRS